jgi:hypothetical protein
MQILQTETMIVADHMAHSQGVSVAAGGYYYDPGQFKDFWTKAHKWALTAPNGAVVTYESFNVEYKLEKIDGNWYLTDEQAI